MIKFEEQYKTNDVITYFYIGNVCVTLAFAIKFN